MGWYQRRVHGCKTNIPQSMLSFGCGNPIWGMTKNPFCKDRTPGGSSGGEACLGAAGGATFGIGSAIGGSVRVPASFCGISSIKPTSRRMSYKGFHISSKVVGIDAVPGIVAKDTSTVILISKLLLQQDCLQTFDDSMLPIPWNEQLSQPGRKLKIGYYEDDGFFPTTPGVQRAVRMAREHYEKLGHELIPFRPFNVEALVKSYGFMMVADQAETLLTNLSVDDIDPSLKYLMWMVKTPHFLKRLFSPLLSFFSPRSLPMVLGSGGRGGKLSSQLWKLVSERHRPSIFGRFVHYSVQLLGFTCRNCARHSRKRGGSKEIGRLQYFRCPCETGEADDDWCSWTTDRSANHWSSLPGRAHFPWNGHSEFDCQSLKLKHSFTF